MIDIVLLRMMKNRSDYHRLIKTIPQNPLDQKTKTILTDFGKYFNKFPEHESIDFQVFLPRFKNWHSTMDKEVLEAYIKIIRNSMDDIDESTKQGLMLDLYEADLATNIANLCQDFSEGNLDAPLNQMISSLVDKYKMNTGAQLSEWNTSDIGDLLAEDLNNEGIRWRLNTLNECMRPLRFGDFGILAGRPDKGKTTLISSEVTFMASQLPEDRNVLWLNNEGPSGRIVKRLYQSALGKNITDLVTLNSQGKLRSMYEKTVGRLDRIRVFDIHGMHVGQVEALIEQNNPGIIIYDMIDNIKGFGSAARTDLQLELMYQWARECSVKYDAIGIATSQISSDGEGEQFPPMSALKDSKTGKQGACDFQIMIGTSNSEGLQGVRWISVPKNKLRRDGSASDPRCEISFKPTIARFEDVQDGS